MVKEFNSLDSVADLEEFANQYFDWDMDKSVPLGLLFAWIAKNLERPEGWENVYVYDRKAFVDVTALQSWATSVAKINSVEQD